VIILLDLNYTLCDVAKGAELPATRHFFQHIQRETYRQWLVDLLRPEKVLLITARPQKWELETKWSIWNKTHWQPEACFFNGSGQRPPAFKDWTLRYTLFPQFGKDPANYFAIESNPLTREMYAKRGVRSCSVQDLEALLARKEPLPWAS
jgi:hypothetical protein